MRPSCLAAHSSASHPAPGPINQRLQLARHGAGGLLRLSRLCCTAPLPPPYAHLLHPPRTHPPTHWLPTRYCDRRLVPAVTIRGEVRMRWDNGGGARLAELHGLLVRRLMIRRLKKDVMSQLPPKRRQVGEGGRLVVTRKDRRLWVEAQTAAYGTRLQCKPCFDSTRQLGQLTCTLCTLHCVVCELI